MTTTELNRSETPTVDELIAQLNDNGYDVQYDVVASNRAGFITAGAVWIDSTLNDEQQRKALTYAVEALDNGLSFGPQLAGPVPVTPAEEADLHTEMLDKLVISVRAAERRDGCPDWCNTDHDRQDDIWKHDPEAERHHFGPGGIYTAERPDGTVREGGVYVEDAYTVHANGDPLTIDEAEQLGKDLLTGVATLRSTLNPVHVADGCPRWCCQHDDIDPGHPSAAAVHRGAAGQTLVVNASSGLVEEALVNAEDILPGAGERPLTIAEARTLASGLLGAAAALEDAMTEVIDPDVSA